MTEVIVTQHGIRCLRCDDELYSGHRHDLRWCTCGAVFVDGGSDYLRIGGELADFVRISREVERPAPQPEDDTRA